MPHHTPLIATISVGLVLAFAFGLLAHRLKISPLVGYLMAGVAVGPFTPGFVADAELAAELAEIGVILLMFAVGLHFSLKDLMSVRNIAVPGAVVQIAVATLMGMALAWALGWSLQAGMVFGLAMNRLPQKANEISGLMVMAIAGGAIIPPIMGAVKSSVGPNGLIFVLLACLAYLLGLGLFASKAKS